MNIIGGIYRGRVIAMPRGVKIRPTSNKVREALFNILGQDLTGKAVLDLFAGSGALGLEAISRGAGRVVFVDNDGRCIRAIKANLKKLVPGIDIRVTQLNALQAIKKLSADKEGFDIVFMDPPYHEGWTKKTLINLGQCDILKNLGIVVSEHHKKEETAERAGRLVRFRQSRYGDTVISFYKNEAQSSISRDV